MDKQSYEAAMATINSADKDTLTTLHSEVSDFAAALDKLKGAVAAVGADFPTVSGPVIGARAVLDNISAQVVSCGYQVQSMRQIVDMALAAYTPVPAIDPQG